MPDLLFIGLVIGFFAVAVGLVRACDRIIGPDPAVPVGTLDEDRASVPEDRDEPAVGVGA